MTYHQRNDNNKRSHQTVSVATMTLETEMDECYRRLLSEQVFPGSASMARPFVKAFEFELDRISKAIGALNHCKESQSKALLENVHGMSRSNSKKKVAIATQVAKLRRKALELQTEVVNMVQQTQQNAEQLRRIAETADTKIGTHCVGTCELRMNHEPWTQEASSSTIAILLSDIFETLRSIENSNDDQDEWVAPSTFNRSTTKYWVTQENLPELLLKSVSELPILVYGKKGRLQEDPMTESPPSNTGSRCIWTSFASPITSVYFDSVNLDLYNERIARSEGAQLFRVRWYGDSKPKGEEVVFLELKTHHEKWSGMKSVKERVAIQEYNLAKLIDTDSGAWSTEYARNIVLSANPNGGDKSINKGTKLLLEIRNLVCDLKLRPCVRTTYTRLALQSSMNNHLRLTIDRDITVVDETKAVADVNNDAIVKIPYSVFEVKVAEGESPKFLEDLVVSNAIIEAKKFSKFLTGAAIHNAETVSTFPWWAADPTFVPVFNKSATAAEDLHHASSQQPPRVVDLLDFTVQQQKNVLASNAFGRRNNRKETEQYTVATEDDSISLSSNGESAPLLCTEMSSNNKNDFCWRAMEEGKTYHGGNLKKKAIEPVNCLAKFLSAFLPTRKDLKSKEEPPILRRKQVKPVEAKTYLANERTFLKWAGTSATFMTFGSLISNFSGAQSKEVLFLFVMALFAAIYAPFQYYRRMHLMASGQQSSGYSDYYGPGIFSAIMIMITCMLLFYTIETLDAGPILISEQGTCVKRSLEGVSSMMFQPSDLFVDDKRGLLLAPSLDEIVGVGLSPGIPASNKANEVDAKLLADNIGADIKAIQSFGNQRQIYALSGGEDNPSIIALEWTANEKLVSKSHWELPPSSVKTMAYAPKSTLFDQSVLIVASERRSTAASEGDGADRIRLDVYDAPFDQNKSALKTNHRLNFKSIARGLNDPSIAAMQYFEGLLFVLFNNERLIRAVDKMGNVVQDVRLPTAERGFEKQWKGMSLQRRDNKDLVLYLALNAPSQIWSIKLDLDNSSGSGWKLPRCASAR